MACEKGAASSVCEKGVGKACEKGVEEISLEVAVDNAPARALYERLDFRWVGRRLRYYRRDCELIDALVMCRTL